MQEWDAGQDLGLGCRIGMQNMTRDWDVGLGCRTEFGTVMQDVIQDWDEGHDSGPAHNS